MELFVDYEALEKTKKEEEASLGKERKVQETLLDILEGKIG